MDGKQWLFGQSAVSFLLAVMMTSVWLAWSGLVLAGAPEPVSGRAGNEVLPAINACATGLSPDLDNVPRPFSSAYDMGAYEYFVDRIFHDRFQF